MAQSLKGLQDVFVGLKSDRIKSTFRVTSKTLIAYVFSHEELPVGIRSCLL